MVWCGDLLCIFWDGDGRIIHLVITTNPAAALVCVSLPPSITAYRALVSEDMQGCMLECLGAADRAAYLLPT